MVKNTVFAFCGFEGSLVHQHIFIKLIDDRERSRSWPYLTSETMQKKGKVCILASHRSYVKLKTQRSWDVCVLIHPVQVCSSPSMLASSLHLWPHFITFWTGKPPETFESCLLLLWHSWHLSLFFGNHRHYWCMHRTYEQSTLDKY